MTYLAEVKKVILADIDRKGISLPRIKKAFGTKVCPSRPFLIFGNSYLLSRLPLPLLPLHLNRPTGGQRPQNKILLPPFYHLLYFPLLPSFHRIDLQPRLIIKALRSGVASGELIQTKIHYKLPPKPRRVKETAIPKNKKTVETTLLSPQVKVPFLPLCLPTPLLFSPTIGSHIPITLLLSLLPKLIPPLQAKAARKSA